MTWTLRAATPADAGEIFRLIKALADYEKLSDEVTGSAEALREHLFGGRPYAEVIMAEVDGRTAGFALFLHDYSTFKTRPGIWVEDIFVEPELRGRGIGTALLARVARVAVERGCARLEWTVLDWNTPAIRFYERQGAEVLRDWRVCRVTGEALERLAQP
jgi:GNAT superfamily N-acetyltransferase